MSFREQPFALSARCRAGARDAKRPSIVFFSLIAVSLAAATVLIALLVAGDVAGPKVAMNNLPRIAAR
jgi:hypothetical protein